MTIPTGPLERRHAQPPLGGTQPDPWAAFRDTALIEFPLAFQPLHSFGKLSRFFLALGDRQLMATHCPACGATWMPPRVMCPEDRAITEWVELPHVGTLTSFVRPSSRLAPGGDPGNGLGYIRLDGATTAILQRVWDPDRVLFAGARVQAAWSADNATHPMQRFWFEPLV